MPTSYCSLELQVAWLDRERYTVAARFTDPNSDQISALADPVEVRIDLRALDELALDTEQYGQALTEMVFGSPQDPNPVSQAFKHSLAATSRDEGLRVRLEIQESAPELNRLRWETLRDPTDVSRRLASEHVWFSRFLSSKDFRPRSVSRGPNLSALVVVASPSDLESKWRLPPIDRAAETDRAKAALKPHHDAAVPAIATRVLEAPATLYNIVTEMRERSPDVLYLVCHGAMTQGSVPRLLLEKEDRTADLINGKELVERLSDMNQRPRLVVLASCQSASPAKDGVLAAIGPKLAVAGVPSVVAMQGNLTMQTSERFMSRLFRELADTGQIDRAVALARSDVSDRPDWWMPVLFLRLQTGRLLAPRVAQQEHFEHWHSIAIDIQQDQCIPVLGPGLVEATIGSSRDIARAWAERYEFPLAPRNRDDLVQVAQYLAYHQTKNVVLSELRKHLAGYIRSNFAEPLEAAGRKDLVETNAVVPGLVDELILAIGNYQRSCNKFDAHRILAKLPFRFYINANRDNLLRDALIGEKREPQVLLCPWIVINDKPRLIGDPLPKDYKPTIQNPLILQPFGNMKWPESIVLTEDDYFDFLASVTRNERLRKISIPTALSSALSRSGWLLLGFQPDDWEFRILLRGVLTQPGDALHGKKDNIRVAVQMDPTEDRMIDPERASRYIQKYFERQAAIDTFWGTPEEFLKELAETCVSEGVIEPID